MTRFTNACLRHPVRIGSAAAVLLVLALPTPAAGQAVTVVRWSDGDTVVTTAGKVRLIGINAPDRGECGYGKATKVAKRLAPVGTSVHLVNPKGVQDRDHYDRLLRYVKVGGVDVGLRQVKNGSQARYDGLDGYDQHPKQHRYRRADRNHANYCEGSAAPSGDLKSYAPASEYDCPQNAQIKGNDKSDDPDWTEPYKGIYHLPGHDYYDITKPEECFASEAGALAAGYRKSGA